MEQPEVRSRFLARELRRKNAKRLPMDMQAFRFVACLVREQPELATRIVHAPPGSVLERGLTQAILLNGRACLGDVRRVTIDPLNLRYYVVDVFYRWIVAVRGTDSLIPASPD